MRYSGSHLVVILLTAYSRRFCVLMPKEHAEIFINDVQIQLILLAATALWFALRHASFLISSEVEEQTAQ